LPGKQEVNLSWRQYADWAKQRPAALYLADRLGRGRGRFRVLDRVRPPPRAPNRPDLSKWDQHDVAAVWIGHATVLLRIGGMNLLTDPVLGNRIGVGLGLMTGGPRRLVAPALGAHELPKLDAILLSHAHFDHLDKPSLARLNRDATVITAHHTRDLVRDIGFDRVIELNWGEKIELRDPKKGRGVTVHAREVKHWGARTFFDMNRGYNAYLIEGEAIAGAAPRRILYAGDSAYHDSFSELGTSGGVDLAIVGIGAYDPWIAAHATPEQAWVMARHAGARHVLPMHHSTFKLGHEPMAEPMHRLLAAARDELELVVVHSVGEQWALNGR
jgi:L-ascorbate metabolism protein UlaG (beta-lactamase superfamily)